jgi:hypothetical protein
MKNPVEMINEMYITIYKLPGVFYIPQGRPIQLRLQEIKKAIEYLESELPGNNNPDQPPYDFQTFTE